MTIRSVSRSVLLATLLLAPGLCAAEVFASHQTNTCLANSGGNAVVAPCRSSSHSNTMPYKSGENVFYGPLQQGGMCLDVNGAQRVVWAGCNGGKSQVWKLSGGAAQLNNEQGHCVVVSGSSVVTAGCPQSGKWYNLSYKTISVPGIKASPGTVIKVSGANLVDARTGEVVAANASRLIGDGGGTIVAGGGGNIVQSGNRNVVGIVAAGGGN